MISIGYKVILRSNRKTKRVSTVVDILTTRNEAKEIVEVRFLLEHDFLGQSIKHKAGRSEIMRGERVA